MTSNESKDVTVPVSETALIPAMKSILSGFGRFANALHEATDFLPAARSQAAREYQTDDGDRGQVETNYSLAATLLMAAENHLEATSRLLVEPLTHYGLFAVCRAAMENSARAWWLLDPDIDVKERVARGLLTRFFSLHEAAQVEELMNPDKKWEELQSVARARDVAERARAQGFTVTATKRGRFGLEGVERPSTTALLEEVHEELGAVMYKYLSASVHGTSYALMQEMEFEESARGGMGRIAKPSGSFTMIGASISVAGLTYLFAFDRHVYLYGHHVDEWVSWRTHALKVLRRAAP